MLTQFYHSATQSPKSSDLPLSPDLFQMSSQLGTLLPSICKMAGIFCSLSFSFHAACSKKGSISHVGCRGTCCLYSKGLFRIQSRVCHSQHCGPFWPHHSPGGLSSALQVLISILYLYSLPTPWLPFPSGQSKMAQHIASSPLGGRNHFWLRTNEFEAFIILENRTCSGMQWFYYFCMVIIFQL